MKKLIDKLFLFMGYVPYGKLINDSIVIEHAQFEIDKLINQKQISRTEIINLPHMESTGFIHYFKQSMKNEMLQQLEPYFIYTSEENMDGSGWTHKLLLYIGRRK